MHFPEEALLYGKRLLQQGRRLVIPVLIDESLAHRGHHHRSPRVLIAIPGLLDSERLPVILLSLAIIAQIWWHLAQVKEIIRDPRMSSAIKLPIHSQPSLIERIRDREVPQVVMRHPQPDRAVGKVGGHIPLRRLTLNCLIESPNGLVVSAALFQYPPQGGLGFRHGGVL